MIQILFCFNATTIIFKLMKTQSRGKIISTDLNTIVSFSIIFRSSNYQVTLTFSQVNKTIIIKKTRIHLKLSVFGYA